jgi:methylated-DNA-protein-cysteine methyltransferase-like protein
LAGEKETGLHEDLLGRFNIYKIRRFVKMVALYRGRYTLVMPSETTIRIREVLARIPRGKVVSYGSAAALAGLPNGARQVVRVLHSSAEKAALPWHRLLRKDGSIALPPGGGFELQRALLLEEGVEVSVSPASAGSGTSPGA